MVENTYGKGDARPLNVSIRSKREMAELADRIKKRIHTQLDGALLAGGREYHTADEMVDSAHTADFKPPVSAQSRSDGERAALSGKTYHQLADEYMRYRAYKEEAERLAELHQDRRRLDALYMGIPPSLSSEIDAVDATRHSTTGSERKPPLDSTYVGRSEYGRGDR